MTVYKCSKQNSVMGPNILKSHRNRAELQTKRKSKMNLSEGTVMVGLLGLLLKRPEATQQPRASVRKTEEFVDTICTQVCWQFDKEEGGLPPGKLPLLRLFLTTNSCHNSIYAQSLVGKTPEEAKGDPTLPLVFMFP